MDQVSQIDRIRFVSPIRRVASSSPFSRQCVAGTAYELATRGRTTGYSTLRNWLLDRAALGDGVEGDGGGDAGVQGLQGGAHRDRHQLVAGLRHQAREAVALGADHDDQ